MSNNCFAFIFARGGSKGLPKKNIKLLLGKPLIQYSIEVAKSIETIDEVFVSTDDPEIAKISESLGASIIMRPKELATDRSPEWLSWRHAIEWVERNRGEFKYFMSLPATSPLRIAQDVNAALLKISSSGCDICIGISPSSRSPYFNMVIKQDDTLKIVVNGQEKISRRQDAPNVYDVTTVVYVSTPSFILNNTGIFSGRVTSIDIPKDRAVDIDDIYDFMLAESILKCRQDTDVNKSLLD